MSTLMSLTTAHPDHVVTATDTRDELARMLRPSAAARHARLVEAAGNATRHVVAPFADLRRLTTIEERNCWYAEHAVKLAGRAAEDAIEAAGVARQSIGTVVCISSSGYVMPTLDTRLIQHLRLTPQCKRVPLLNLGCSGGAAGLALGDMLAAAQGTPVLVVSVELPSLSFPTGEYTPHDVVASTQFGDGAAAVVLSSTASGAGPEVIATGSFLFPDTIERDGVRLTPSGFRLMRPRGLAELLRSRLGEVVETFLSREGVSIDDVTFWAVHPRSPDLIDAVADALHLSHAAAAPARAVWEHSGNLSSAAVFHVLEEIRRSARPTAGALGAMVAFGAGFACEMALLRADGWLCAGHA